jgi:hypothetical protein
MSPLERFEAETARREKYRRDSLRMLGWVYLGVMGWAAIIFFSH